MKDPHAGRKGVSTALTVLKVLVISIAFDRQKPTLSTPIAKPVTHWPEAPAVKRCPAVIDIKYTSLGVDTLTNRSRRYFPGMTINTVQPRTGRESEDATWKSPALTEKWNATGVG